MYYRWFKCPECGQVLMAPKINSQEGGTEIRHQKEMWCPICLAKQQFVLFDVVGIRKGRTRR